jgi:F0F1-type ATP synthase epsilon subunit
VAPTGLTILAEEARPVADFNRTEIEALIASGQTALEAATTAADQDRLTNELNAWRNLLIDAQANGTAAAH